MVAAALVLSGCSSPNPNGGDRGGRDVPPAGIATGPEQPTLIASDDATELALNTSATYFTSATFAVVADPADPYAIARAASIAATVGVPALLAETAGRVGADGASPVDAELDRLGAEAVVAVGAVDGELVADDIAVVPAPDAAGELGSLLGVRVTEVALDPAAPVSQLAGLGDGEVITASAPDNATEASATGTRGELPAFSTARRIEGAATITDGSPAQTAALGTARAAGATAVLAPDAVGASPETIALLAGRTSIVGLGHRYGDDATFTWQALTATTGIELPGGGQQVFGGKRYIALYGSPATASLGLLGEQGTNETVARAEQMAAPYAGLTEDRIIPALEIIVTIASGGAGEDGNYSNELPVADFVPLVEAAQAAGQYVVLDFQPGRTDFVTQVEQYEELLRYPHVGIALDPEWRLRPNQVHLNQIGSVEIDEVNRTVKYLADFVRENRLPQKLLVLHQFQTRMIPDRAQLDTSRAEVALLVHADGQGSQEAKQDTWRTLHVDPPEGVAWGWKNFIDEDQPILTPEQTYQQVDPLPEFVSYQ